MNDSNHHSILAAATVNSSPADLESIVAAVQTELATPSGDRSRLITDAGRRLMAMPEDCLDRARIDTLLEVGQLAYFDGRSAEGLAMVKSAARLAARAADPALQRKALTYEAALHGDLGDAPTALESSAGAIVLARQIGDVGKEATLWGNLGALLSETGDWRGGLRASERALELDPAAGSALVNAAEACLELGNIVKGLRYAQKCIAPSVVGTSLQQLAIRADAEAICGRIRLEVDDLQRATEHAAAARRFQQLSRSERSLPAVLALEGMCKALGGDGRGGMRLLQQARDLRAADAGIDHGQRRAMRWMARLHRMLGDDTSARTLLNEQTEIMLDATMQYFRTASSFRGSTEAPAAVGRAGDLAPGDVYERFSAIAVSLEEGSGEHGFRVSALAALLATDYGCDEAETEAARRGGALHDLGKLCVPPAVLVKEDALDEFEVSAFREHPLHGATLLQDSGASALVLDAVRHHHERWDGQGFPFRLAGDSIPITARIVGICEAFDEMIHSTARKREPWTVRRALEELLRQRGTRFDPRLVDLLIERVRRLQREFGGFDEALSAAADRSTLVVARRRLREMLEAPPVTEATG